MSVRERGINTATLLEILLLAVVQGITEWLPISSSGHLVVAQEYLGLKLPVFFDVMLHVGSFIVVLIIFWHDVVKVLKAVARLDFKSSDGKLGLYIILGSIATALVGFVFKDLFVSFFHNLLAVGVAFILTGSFYSLLYALRCGKQPSRPLNPLYAVLIGVAQGLALIPGVSRSGSTIASGLLLKVDREIAFRFSFLLFIPALVGATVLTGMDTESILIADIDPATVLLALAVVVAVGYLSLKLLFRIVLTERLHLFAYYCWALGIIIVLTQVVRF